LKHEPDEIIKWENLKINLTSREVFINDGKINLTQKEIMLLYLLISRKGAVLTREVLMELVWEQEYLGDPRTINKHIENLRNKLGRLSDSIETVQGVGYRLKK
jgi:two-component system response regulator VanR